MVAYGFKSMFEDPIREGVKPHTLRNDRKRHARPGEEIQIYYGMRTKHCRLIGRATCVAVTPIRISFKHDEVHIDWRPMILRPTGLNAFARRDGFKDWQALREFWRREHGIVTLRGVPRLLPPAWSGVMIEWTNFKGEPR